MARGEPVLMRSALTSRIYVVTSYKELGDGVIDALKKYDVTEQFERLTATTDVPTFTRHADGRITAEWPDPRARTYPVATELIEQLVERRNDLISVTEGWLSSELEIAVECARQIRAVLGADPISLDSGDET